MVTKEQCILERVLEEVNYGRNSRLTQYVLAGYNQGKQYESDMVFENDENGLDRGLEGYSPSFIVFSLLGEDNEYNARDPFFVIENGIKSLDAYDFRRMLTPEDTKKILNQDVLDELDESDWSDAFAIFLYTNYPQIYEKFDYDMLDGYNAYDYQKANWDELAKSIGTRQQEPVMEMTEEELNEIIREGTIKALGKINLLKK